MLRKKIEVYLLYLIIFLFIIKNVVLGNNGIIALLSLGSMLLLTILKIFDYKKILNKEFLLSNFLALLFLFVQFIIIVFFRFNVSSLSIFFNELFYMFTIFLFSNSYKEESDKIFKFITLIIFIINVISVATYCFNYLNIFSLSEILNNDSIMGIHSNPNTAGIMTLIGLMLFIIFFNKKDFKSYLFIIFNLIFMFISNCRTSIYVLIIFSIVYFIYKHFSKYSKKIITLFCVGLILFLGSYYTYMYINKDNDKLNKIETKIDDFFTHRYILSKYSILAMKDNFFVGIDDTKVAELRYQIIPDSIKAVHFEGTVRELLSKNNNTHNSYTQIIVSQGFIIFIFFLVIILLNLYKTNKNNIPILLSILIISFFESNLLITKNFIMLLFIILLGLKESEKKIKSKKKRR